jgi:hypothetical protein
MKCKKIKMKDLEYGFSIEAKPTVQSVVVGVQRER